MIVSGGRRVRRGGGAGPPGAGPLRQATVAALRERFERAVHEGDLPGGPLRDARAPHRHGPERPGGPGRERGDRDGVAEGHGDGDASLARLTAAAPGRDEPGSGEFP